MTWRSSLVLGPTHQTVDAAPVQRTKHKTRKGKPRGSAEQIPEEMLHVGGACCQQPPLTLPVGSVGRSWSGSPPWSSWPVQFSTPNHSSWGYGDVHDADLGVKHRVTNLLTLMKVLRAGGTKFDDAYFVQLVFSTWPIYPVMLLA